MNAIEVTFLKIQHVQMNWEGAAYLLSCSVTAVASTQSADCFDQMENQMKLDQFKSFLIHKLDLNSELSLFLLTFLSICLSQKMK